MMKSEGSAFPRWMTMVLGAALLALLAGGAVFYRSQERVLQHAAEDRLVSMGRLKVDQIDAWRKERLGDGALVAGNPFLTDGITRFMADPSQENAKDIQAFFRTLMINQHYTDILLTSPEGRILMSMTGNMEPNSGYAAGLAEALQSRKPALTQLHMEEQNPVPHISVIAPILSRDGHPPHAMGAVIMIFNASKFLYPLIQTWPTLSKTAETLLIRRDGDHVLFLNDLRHQTGAALKLRIPLTRTDLPAVMTVLGQKGMVRGTDYRGMSVLAVILPVPDSDWFMVAKEDEDEVYAVWRFRSILMLLLWLGFMAVIGAIWLAVRERGRKIHFKELFDSEARLRTSNERHSVTLKGIGDAVIATDVQGRVELLNPVAEALTGWNLEEACGRPLEEVFHILSEETRKKSESPVVKVLHDGMVVGLANHTLLIAKNGEEHPIADSAAPIRNNQGEITGVVLVFRDQTEERRQSRLNQVRIALLEYASDHSLEDLLTKVLDEIGALVDSPIGFYHFVDADQRTLSLQQWSTRTQKEFCQAQGRGTHYDIDQAGVWADGVGTGKPIIHNDYASLPNRKGMPDGHAEVIRELVVPVMRKDKVVAILGLGNKPLNYTEKDAETVAFLADVIWPTVEQKRAERALMESERKWRNILVNIPQIGISLNPQGQITFANPHFLQLTGWTEEEALGQDWFERFIPPEIQDDIRRVFRETMRDENHSGFSIHENEILSRNGRRHHVVWSNALTLDAQGTLSDVTCIGVDLSERKAMEAQLNQAQRMESVGRLAGGVAHDFNNMLGVILGYAELAMAKVAPSDSLHGDLQEILNATQRSADVVRQLLAFARKQTIAPRLLDLNETVEGMLKMLRRVLGEDIDLAWLPEPGVCPVRMDLSQIDQILVNLCVNARDAIAGVGKITIETDRVTLDQEYCASHPGFAPGDFILLVVSDNGCGMDKPTLECIFEPFFTTKGVGEGTGLGLATVYGIVKQNNGFINVYSEPEKGTVFRIYLPRHEGEVAAIPAESTAPIPRGQGETVLIVEDEDVILLLIKTMLEKLDYTVLSANSPDDAMSLAREVGDRIHLLITDVVLPGMNGRDLAEQLLLLHPEAKVLFMSGYTADVIAHHGVLDEGVRFLQKPFSMKSVAVKVREALDEGEKNP
ncbi:MAG: PAS domain S-box protein [Proteobacteria bacterium]|nr:PAS domain S-box protein [Pseudomonadota bacterium]MBU4472352.1 PAS domain S-box protein [Pseudomonadota bacterium]MCG2752048.1 PAS domain S-box protein [Desulfobacteraceae bacterium]